MFEVKRVQLHALPQDFSSHYIVEGFKVIYNSTYNWTNYYFNQALTHKQSAKFKFKVLELKNHGIVFGVADFAKEKNFRYCNDPARGNYMGYDSNSHKYPDNVN